MSVPFHHDPGHTDGDLDRMTAEALDEARPAFQVTPGAEGTILDL